MKKIKIIIAGSLIILGFMGCFTSCFHAEFGFDYTAHIEKNPSEELFMVRYLRDTDTNDTLLLKETASESDFVTGYGYFTKFCSREELQKGIPAHYAGSELPRIADSIGVFSVKEKELKAMFYPSWYEESYNKKSSTLYPNPYSASSWTFHLDEKQYAKRDWGVNIGKVVYTLKPTKEE